MKTSVGTLVLALAIAVFPNGNVAAKPQVNSDQTIVQTTDGPIRGTFDNDARVFRGIPYAAPPTGANRWRPPRVVRPWATVRDASQFGPVCPQNVPKTMAEWRRVYYSNASKLEDCLYLNVWTPVAPGLTPLPVMVYLHGGNFERSSGSDPRFDGSELVHDGVVFVTINYRLGLLGRFAHPALTRSQRGEPLVNYDLLDQMAALRWVQTNIARFGGDPGNVTVFGQSAGGVSINFLMASPLAKGLFHKAIVQSGGLLIDRNRHAFERGPPGAEGPSSEDIGVDVARYFEISGTDLQVVAALRALTPEQILKYQHDRPFATNPAVDGVIVPDNVAELFEQGKQHPIPYLAGSNDWEWAELWKQSYIAQWFIGGALIEGLSDDDLAIFEGAWNRALLSQQFYQDGIFTSPARYLAAHMKAVGVPAYRYYLTYVQENLRGEVPGAAHALEIPYVFGLLRRHPEFQIPEVVELTPADFAFSDMIRGYWVSFAKTGDPNGGGRPHWPVYEPDSDETLVLGPTTAPRANLDTEKLDYLDRRALSRRRAFDARD